MLARSKIYAHDQESCSNVKEGVHSALANVPKTQFSYTRMQFQMSQDEHERQSRSVLQQLNPVPSAGLGYGTQTQGRWQNLARKLPLFTASLDLATHLIGM